MKSPDFYNNRAAISGPANFGIRPPTTTLTFKDLRVTKIENVKLFFLT